MKRTDLGFSSDFPGHEKHMKAKKKDLMICPDVA